MNSFIRTEDHLTMVFADGETATVYTTQENFQAVLSAVREKNWEKARGLAIPVVGLKAAIDASTIAGRVTIEGGVVFLDEQAMHNTLTDRMLQMVAEGFDIGPMSAFLANLMDNVSFRAVNELYDFMEKSDLPITEDGHFIAYKRIRENYRDMYTGLIDNSIGATPSMPRNMVDEDKSRTCSEGLHFCSRSYLPHYGNYGANRTIIVKINPRDVVAIPIDYGNAKGRCCLYEVIGELEHRNEEELEGALYGVEPVSIAPIDDGGQERSSVGKAVEMFNVDDPDTTIKVFASPHAAQETTGIDGSSISKVARGQRRRAGGYGWRFVEDGVTDFALTTPVVPSPFATAVDNLNDLSDDLLLDDRLDDEDGYNFRF